jgi:hypothetical protein
MCGRVVYEDILHVEIGVAQNESLLLGYVGRVFLGERDRRVSVDDVEDLAYAIDLVLPLGVVLCVWIGGGGPRLVEFGSHVS